MKPYVTKQEDCTNPNHTWIVGMEGKQLSFFEHWGVAVAFAIYVFRNPHVMHNQ